MRTHTVRVHPSKERLARESQLAWKIAEIAAEEVRLDDEVAGMTINRLIDNAAVALAALDRPPVASARAMALAHPRPGGATIFGMPRRARFSCEWAAWANAAAVRELDFNDTFLAAEFSHPGDNIPPILAVAQQTGRSGRDLVSGIVTGYEVQVALTKGICLHKHKIDHIAHLGPSVAAGIGTLLGLETGTIYQAVQQAAHTTVTTRQSRKGELSSWKAYAPAHAGKLAIEAVDRCMRGENAPSPIYEGEDSIIARLLDGPEAEYEVPLPAPGEARRAILETYTKEHSAEYQAQALIDLAFRLRGQIPERDSIAEIVIHTSHHTHNVIGSGANDPQKMDPKASRETLDHSIMYIFAVALEDGRWHHLDSYAPERASRKSTVRLWHKIRTVEDPLWTARYHDPDPGRKGFGGRVVVTFKDGVTIEDELALADAHPLGARPFGRREYIEKFRTLTEGIISETESSRFIDRVQHVSELAAGELGELNVEVDAERLVNAARKEEGIF